jgi:hypothetical protein
VPRSHPPDHPPTAGVCGGWGLVGPGSRGVCTTATVARAVCTHVSLVTTRVSTLGLTPKGVRVRSDLSVRLHVEDKRLSGGLLVVSPHTRKRNVLIRVGLSTDALTPSLTTAEILTSAYFEHRERGQRVGEKYSLFDSVLNQRAGLLLGRIATTHSLGRAA